jgi:hypothetical protein
MHRHVGWIICKFCNFTEPNTIDERALNVPADLEIGLSDYEMLENVTLALESCRAVGVPVPTAS